jgi:NAD(P)-dependent dehydrogenase (short-subunit alcohol dehydrogenase family)
VLEDARVASSRYYGAGKGAITVNLALVLPSFRECGDGSGRGEQGEKLLNPQALFSISGQTAVITGGGGGLGSAMARTLAGAGARVAIMSLHAASCGKVAAEIRDAGGDAIAIGCDVLDATALDRAHDEVQRYYGSSDILVNAAGGNRPGATVTPAAAFFDLPVDAMREVVDLNLQGTVRACQVFGRDMAERGEGCIVNIASMSGIRPLTGVMGYSAAKAAVANFTQWLAVHMAQRYSPRIRVNAIAPGFFLTDQNRYLLTDAQTGNMTARGEQILAHTPAGRLGEPDDLSGTLLWLVSPASAFVTGTIIPVDGGFAAYSGV